MASFTLRLILTPECYYTLPPPGYPANNELPHYMVHTIGKSK